LRFKENSICIFLLLSIFACVLYAQDESIPKPKPRAKSNQTTTHAKKETINGADNDAGNGRTMANPKRDVAPSTVPLDVTMRFIEDKLNDIGEVTFLVSWQDVTSANQEANKIAIRVSQVIAIANQCSIRLNWRATSDGTGVSEADLIIPLGDVQSVTVKPWLSYQTERNAELGAPNHIATSVNPNITALLVRLSRNRLDVFPFTESSEANRVANALNHATELCGGAQKDPF
jgi:hypothetical protein